MKRFIGTLLLLILVSGYNFPAYAAQVEIDPMGLEVYENNMTRDEYYAQSIVQYSAFDYSDPQTTTDEELFGVWDDLTRSWTVEPLLDYENKPALSEIEEAAKSASGDYSICKELTLKYYQDKFDGFNSSLTPGMFKKTHIK